MRVRLLTAFVFLVGCGKFLGFDEDADEDQPATPVADAGGAASDDASSADGMADAAPRDGGSDGAAGYVWQCVVDTTVRPSYTSQPDCDQGRLETTCRTDLAPPANGDPCDPPEPGTIRATDSYCEACMKTAVGEYNFTITNCDCVHP